LWSMAGAAAILLGITAFQKIREGSKDVDNVK
jgi:hypothetical protein